MKKMRSLALGGVVGLALAPLAQAQSTLTYSTWVPPSHVSSTTMRLVCRWGRPHAPSCGRDLASMAT